MLRKRKLQPEGWSSHSVTKPERRRRMLVLDLVVLRLRQRSQIRNYSGLASNLHYSHSGSMWYCSRSLHVNSRTYRFA